MKLQHNRIIRFNLAMILMTILTLALAGCATVPKESVELNRAVGMGIMESQRSYTALLNAYFTAKKQQVDLWIENEYLPAYLSNIQSELKKAGQAPSLSQQQMSDILHDVTVERDQKNADLENTRLLLLTKSTEHHNMLLQGNAAISGLLQSMVDLREATSTSVQTIRTASGGKVDLDKIELKFNDYLKKAGAASTKATNLYETVKSALEKEE